MSFNKGAEDYREDLVKVLESIKDKNFIVEGKKDVEALHRWSMLHVWAINGKGIYDLCDKLKGLAKEFVILTDFDPEGESIAKKLETQMKGFGMKIDRETRVKLRMVFIKNNLNTVQGLRNLIEDR